MRKKITTNYLSEYLIEVRSKGRFTITLDELRSEFNISEKALQQNIYRLKTKIQIAQVRKGFYVIIPPQYLKRGMLPPTLFIDDMMKFLNRDYYIGLFSAAALHGAGHQQPMEYHVVIKKPALRKIKGKRLIITFFTKRALENNQIIKMKTEAGYLNVSTPELTAFDLIHYNKKIGGLNRIIPILEELTEEIKPSHFAKIAKTQKSPTIQRLGYILGKLGNKTLSNFLFKIIEDKRIRAVPLALAHKNRLGKLNVRWKVIINTKLNF